MSIKKSILGLVMLLFLAVMLGPVRSSAAENSGTKPAKPVITAKVTSAGNAVKITISKTSDAEGYRIYMKAPGESKYKYIKTLKSDGTAKRYYTKKNLTDGDYSFKVRAYRVIDGKKVYGSYSKVAKVTLNRISFVNPMTSFWIDGEENGARNRQPYTFELKYPDELKDSVFLLKSVASDGGAVSDACACMYERELAIEATRMGTVYIRVYAYACEDDARTGSNPIAMSEILQIRFTDENGRTGEEPVIYADITFKNGYAYFGEAPLEPVTDAKKTAKIIATQDDHGVYTYEGERYTYDKQDKKGPFRYIPIEWRILEQTDEYVLLMSNSIINGGAYDGWDARSNSLWKTSCLRPLLNRSNAFTGIEHTYMSIMDLPERVLIPIEAGGSEDLISLPTADMLTKSKYGFGKSRKADKERVVKPSEYYRINTNNKASSYASYWVINESAGKMITVDTSGAICTDAFKCNVYEIGVVPVIKVDLTHCNVISE